MFQFCRRFKFFISYVLIFSHFNSSVSFASDRIFSVALEEVSFPSAHLRLKVQRQSLSANGERGEKETIGRYGIPFEEAPPYQTFQENFFFQGTPPRTVAPFIYSTIKRGWILLCIETAEFL